MAAPAIVIDRTELNQQAMITADDFPRIYWGKSRGHRVVGVPEPATPLLLTVEPDIGGEVPAAGTICGTRPVDVKVKMHKAANLCGEIEAKAVSKAVKSRRGQGKSMI